jgi:hypothetical protein
LRRGRTDENQKQKTPGMQQIFFSASQALKYGTNKKIGKRKKRTRSWHLALLICIVLTITAIDTTSVPAIKYNIILDEF